MAIPNSYACCVFRGSVVAVDANRGKELWQKYTVLDNGGKPARYSGGQIGRAHV